MRNTRKIIVALLVLMTLMVSMFAVTANAAAGQTWTVAGSQALCGTNWSPSDKNNDMTYDAATDSYVKIYTNVKAGNYEFKCAKNHAWGTAYPSSNYNLKVAKDGSTVTITLKGTTVKAVVEAPSCNHVYEVTAQTVTCVAAGTRTWTCSVCSDSYTENLAALGHRYGEDGKCKSCDATTAVVKVYVDNAANWANVYCYAWATDPYVAWPGEAMEKGEDGLYFYVVPKSCVNIIFNNGEGTQSADLKTPTTNAVVYNNAGKTWAEKGEEVEIPEVTYIVAGNTALTGFDWNPNQTANIMTLGEDGLYTKVYENVAAGKHEFKVVQDGDWNLCWGDPANTAGGNNYVIDVVGGSKVTITFNPANKEVKCTVEAPETPVADTYTVSGTICPDGQWNLDDDLMTLGDDGIYSITYTDVKKGGYSFKVFKNRSWDNGYSDGNENYDCFIKYDGSVVTIKFDPATSTITHEVYYNDEQVIVYIVAGSSSLLGSNWAHTDVNNEMTKLEDGKYQLVIENAAAGSHTLKVVKDGNWDIAACGAPDGTDYALEVATAGSKVTITYDPAAHAITHTVEAPHVHSYEADVTAPTCTTAGFTTYTCACGDSYTGDEVVATGHSFSEGKCTVCEAEDPDYVPEQPETDPTKLFFNADIIASGTNGFYSFTTSKKADVTAKIDGVVYDAGLKFNSSGYLTFTPEKNGTVTMYFAHANGAGSNTIYIITLDAEGNELTKEYVTIETQVSDENNEYSTVTINVVAGANYKLTRKATESTLFAVIYEEAETPACEHEYTYSCDAHCNKCGELTNPNAAHTIVHNAAVPAGCETNGNVEHWSCSVCGYCWSDEALTMVTNQMSIVVPAIGHNYFYNLCLNCYGPNPHFIDNFVAAGENKLVCNQYHLVDTETHLKPYQFTFLTILEDGVYNFTTTDALSITVFTTAVTEDNASDFETNGPGWLVYDQDGNVELKAGVYYIGFVYFTGEGEYTLNIEKEIPHEHNFVEGKCECGETDPNYQPPVEPEDPTDPEQPEQPEQPVEELSFFEKIMKAISDFIAQITAWFQNLFAGNKE